MPGEFEIEGDVRPDSIPDCQGRVPMGPGGEERGACEGAAERKPKLAIGMG